MNKTKKVVLTSAIFVAIITIIAIVAFNSSDINDERGDIVSNAESTNISDTTSETTDITVPDTESETESESDTSAPETTQTQAEAKPSLKNGKLDTAKNNNVVETTATTTSVSKVYEEKTATSENIEIPESSNNSSNDKVMFAKPIESSKTESETEVSSIKDEKPIAASFSEKNSEDLAAELYALLGDASVEEYTNWLNTNGISGELAQEILEYLA